MPSEPTPVVIGINWYERFDNYFQDDKGHYWISRSGMDLGRIRGGHCICVASPHIIDRWWPFYDQGSEGACVGFGWSRYASLMNRVRYDGFKLYHEAQKIDEWAGENYSGTSVRAGGDVLRTLGAWKVLRGKTQDYPDAEAGIVQYRWATTIEQVAQCLSPHDDGHRILSDGFLVLLNSWGPRYPAKVRMDLDTAYRVLFKEEGDVSMATDRPALPNTARGFLV